MEIEIVTDGLDTKDLQKEFIMLILREGNKEIAIERKKDTNEIILKYYDTKKKKAVVECTLNEFIKLLSMKKSAN
jgi:hypothetical protein